MVTPLELLSSILFVVVSVVIGLWVSRSPKMVERRQERSMRRDEQYEMLKKAGLNPYPEEGKRKIVRASIAVLFALLMAFFIVFVISLVSDVGIWYPVYFAIFALSLVLPPVAVISIVFPLFADFVGRRAEKGGRSYLAFYVLSWIISPVITLLIASSFKPHLEGTEGRAATTASSSASQEKDIQAKLLELTNLKEKGLISEDEFQASRKNVLGL